MKNQYLRRIHTYNYKPLKLCVLELLKYDQIVYRFVYEYLKL